MFEANFEIGDKVWFGVGDKNGLIDRKNFPMNSLEQVVLRYLVSITISDFLFKHPDEFIFHA